MQSLTLCCADNHEFVQRVERAWLFLFEWVIAQHLQYMALSKGRKQMWLSLNSPAVGAAAEHSIKHASFMLLHTELTSELSHVYLSSLPRIYQRLDQVLPMIYRSGLCVYGWGGCKIASSCCDTTGTFYVNQDFFSVLCRADQNREFPFYEKTPLIKSNLIFPSKIRHCTIQ